MTLGQREEIVGGGFAENWTEVDARTFALF
jgi:hypothetical protein